MIEFTTAIEIDRPVPEVFAYVTDPAKLATWQTNTLEVTQETDGPLRVGTRLREVHRAPGGRRLTSLVEVVELEPERAFALRILDGPLPVDGRFVFAPASAGAGGGARVEVHGSGAPRGVLRVLSPLLGRVLRRQFAAHLAALKQVMEASGG
ncbi:MAG TPA: SRPBCC family protein [Conexibacter sp.]